MRLRRRATFPAHLAEEWAHQDWVQLVDLLASLAAPDSLAADFGPQEQSRSAAVVVVVVVAQPGDSGRTGSPRLN